MLVPGDTAHVSRLWLRGAGAGVPRRGDADVTSRMRGGRHKVLRTARVASLPMEHTSLRGERIRPPAAGQPRQRAGTRDGDSC